MKTTRFLTALLLLAAVPAAQAGLFGESKPDPATAVLPMPIGQAEVDWFKTVADTSGLTDRLESIADTTRAALSTAATAIQKDAKTWSRVSQVADTARTALTAANRTRSFDFAGKTFARESRRMALEYAAQLAADSTAAPGIKEIAARMAAKKRLTAAQENLAANLWIAYLVHGGQAQARLDQLESGVTNDFAAGIKAEGQLTERLEALEIRLADTEHALAQSLGALNRFAGNGKRKELAKAVGAILADYKP